jgi:Tol biopolymer transport system component
MTTLNAIQDLRVSPTGSAVLVATDGPREHDSVLLVVPADGSRAPLQLSDTAAWYGDWSADGRYVYFIRANAPARADNGAQRLGALSGARVVDEQGAIMAKTPPIKDLAGLIYSEFSRVRCMKTGQVLFSGAEVKLPATSGDMPDRAQLFSIEPGQEASVTRVLTAQAFRAIGNAAQYFEVSPDGSHVSIPDSSGKVCIVDLRNGVVQEIQPKPTASGDQRGDGLLTIPQWRSDGEITFMAPGADGHPVVELWSVSKNAGKLMNSRWPAELVSKKAPAPSEKEPGGL